MHLIKKRILAICLTVCMALAVGICAYPKVWAAERVDTTRKGSLELTLAIEDSAQMGQDLASLEEDIQVHAWKLADMLESGRYTFSGEFSVLSLGEESGEDNWKQLTEDALSLIYELDEEGRPEGTPQIEPTYTGTIRVTEDGMDTETSGFDDMELGLYLVMAENIRSQKYEYSFSPMIVSLPWSEYQYAGEDAAVEASDEWQYSRQAVMKPAYTQLYGNVKIVKTLTAYNTAQGDVTFVFDVTARDGEEVVYSNVVSATFSAVGTQEILLEHIPAGAMVTVTEVYSGANCQITVADGESKAVLAEAEDGSTEPITFHFENAYNEEAKRGYGVENRFRYNTEQESYEWMTNRSEILSGGDEG